MSIGISGDVSSNIGLKPGQTPSSRVQDAPAQTQPQTTRDEAGRDRSAVYDISGSSQGLQGALSAIGLGVNRALAAADAATAALRSIVEALDDAETSSASPIDEDKIQAVFERVDGAISASGFDGVNLLDGSLPDGLLVLDALNGSPEVRAPSFDLNPGGDVLVVSVQTFIGQSATEQSIKAALEQSKANVRQALETLLDNAKQLNIHGQLVARALEGNTPVQNADVDEDLSAEGALLLALQAQQDLAATDQGITDGQSQSILSLFRTA